MEIALTAEEYETKYLQFSALSRGSLSGLVLICSITVNWGYIERQGYFEQLCGKCLNDWYCTANRQSGRVSNSVSKRSDLRKQACNYKHFMLLT